jgi:hypothetical protein
MSTAVGSSPIRLCEVHTIPLDSLRVFSEMPAIVCLFGARRLSQQSYPFFPEPRKGTYPYMRGHPSSELGSWLSAALGEHAAMNFR